MSKTTPQFDFEKAVEALKAGHDLSGQNGILTPLIKQLTEAALAAELEQHIESGDEQDRKILSLFAPGSSYTDIMGHIAELYGIDVSAATINTITDKLIPELREWQQRSLDSHYPFVWLDAIHYIK